MSLADRNRIGVALFADASPFSRSGNFACVQGYKPFEFSSSSDLPAQTLWITNASLNDLIEAGLHRNPKIAHDAYFRTRIAQLIHELGIDVWGAEQQAAMLAEVLGVAAEMGRLQLGLVQYPSGGIAQAVGQLYGNAEPATGSSLLHIAERACQRYTSCERERRYEKAKIFTFWLPRFDWSQKLLSEPLPTNDTLKPLSPHALPGMGRDVSALVDWAIESNLPLFAQIRINGLESVVGRLLNYGAGAQNLTETSGAGAEYEARNMREWCSLPELDVLSQAGDIQIKQVAVAGGWSRSGVRLLGTKACTVSYSYGLVAENMWVGMTRRPSPDGKLSRSLSTAWLQALDRMHCLRIAEKLHSVGMEVTNYGYGRLTVVCPQSVYALVPKVAREYGLMYPASLRDLPKPPGLNPAHASEVLQQLMLQGDHASMLRVSQIALREMEASRAA